MSLDEKDGCGAGAADFDAVVERVLAELRETRVPEGLERRVLGAMDARASAEPHGVRPWVWAAAAVVVLAAVLAPVMLRGRHREVAVKQMPTPVREVARAVQVPVRADAVKAVAVKAAARRNRIEMRPVMSHVAAAPEAAAVPAATRAMDALARAEANAPSRPAPPEPLTEEERRLMRVATQGTEEQRAALNPVVREQRYEAAKQAVMEFFEPPKPADQVQE